MNTAKTPPHIKLDEKIAVSDGGRLELKNRLSGNSSCKHFFTLPESLVMVWKIKPQRAQRDTESCYFSLLSPLCPPCPLWFSETLFRKYLKVSDVLVTATQDTRDPENPFSKGYGLFFSLCGSPRTTFSDLTKASESTLEFRDDPIDCEE